MNILIVLLIEVNLHVAFTSLHVSQDSFAKKWFSSKLVYFLLPKVYCGCLFSSHVDVCYHKKKFQFRPTFDLLYSEGEVVYAIKLPLIKK